MEHNQIIELDVRPHLRKKLEPFQLIMDAVGNLTPDDIFVLHATFKPTPLLGLLKVKGMVNKVEKLAKDHWVVTFVNKRNKHLLNITDAKQVAEEKITAKHGEGRDPMVVSLDNRGLEPPQPMMRTLAALERGIPGDLVKIHNDRVPVFLIEELRNLGYPFSVDEQADGSAKIAIKKI